MYVRYFLSTRLLRGYFHKLCMIFQDLRFFEVMRSTKKKKRKMWQLKIKWVQSPLKKKDVPRQVSTSKIRLGDGAWYLCVIMNECLYWCELIHVYCCLGFLKRHRNCLTQLIELSSLFIAPSFKTTFHIFLLPNMSFFPRLVHFVRVLPLLHCPN